jgi:hypothetical protein
MTESAYCKNAYRLLNNDYNYATELATPTAQTTL